MTFCLEVSEREAPCRYKGLWLSGQNPLSSPLALIPPNKRSLLPEGQESPTGQALSSACSIFPAPLGSFKGSDSHPPSSDPGGSQQTVRVALSPPPCCLPQLLGPAPRSTPPSTHRPGWCLELGLGCCACPQGWIPRSQLCRRMLRAGCWGCSGGAVSNLQGPLGHGESHHFCKPLSTGDLRNQTLCNGWVTVASGRLYGQVC